MTVPLRILYNTRHNCLTTGKFCKGASKAHKLHTAAKPLNPYSALKPSFVFVLQLRVCACSSQCCRPAEWRCGQQLCFASSEMRWAQCASLLPPNLVSRRLSKLLGLLPLGRRPELLPTGHAASCCSISICRQPELDTMHKRHLSDPLDPAANAKLQSKSPHFRTI